MNTRRSKNPFSNLLLPALLAILWGASCDGLGAQEALRSDALFPVQPSSLLPAAVGADAAAGSPYFLSPAPAFTPVIQSADRRSRGIKYMIGGGVAVVAGSLIGGDGGTLIIVGGLVSLGYGFYLYHDP
jgi:hypothetical protein